MGVEFDIWDIDVELSYFNLGSEQLRINIDGRRINH